MQKQIWYGAKDNAVRFADNQTALTNQGIDNPQSFTVNGDVSGLNLIGSEATSHVPQGKTNA